MTYQVKVADFEGPLDLLLHLIRRNELDIYTISIAEIANQYLEYVEMMQALNLDGVGEFLVMAATLAYHKSRMLLPESARQAEDEEDEEFESLEDLHRRLIEYQRYKEASQDLQSRDLLNRDVFRVTLPTPDSRDAGCPVLLKATLFDLLEAFYRILQTAPKDIAHNITPERIKLVDRIVEVVDAIRKHGAMSLDELLLGQPASREMLIATFLAVLELVRLQLVRAWQSVPYAQIQIRLAGEGIDHEKVLKEKLPSYEN